MMTRRSTLLLGLGVAVCVLGLGLAVVSLGHRKAAASTAVHTAGSTASTAPAATPAVIVATKAIPAGTTGEAMIEAGDVTMVTPPASAYKADDLTSVTSLNQQALTAAVEQGQPIETSNLHVDAGDVSPPAGDESVAITLTSAQAAVAGYLSPGDQVDVYGNVTKLSSGPAASASSDLTTPCTTRLATQVPVLDVSQQVPSYRGTKTATGRTAPATETLLLAVTPSQAGLIIFYQENEDLYLTTAASNPPPSDSSNCSAITTTPQLSPTP